MNQPQQTQRATCLGFTLVETLVAVLMLSVVMIAITALLTRSLQAVATSQDYFLASKIALEGMEMMRAKRNNNLIASRPENTIVWNSAMGSGTYELDTVNNISALDPGAALPPLSVSPRRLCVSTADATAGRYTYTNSNNSPPCSGTDTQALQGNFTRTITISSAPNPNDPWLQVTVTVSTGSLDTPYTLTSILFNAS